MGMQMRGARWILGVVALCAAALTLAVAAGGGRASWFAPTPGPSDDGTVAAEQAYAPLTDDGVAGSPRNPDGGEAPDDSGEPAPLAPVAHDLRGPTPERSTADAEQDALDPAAADGAGTSFKLKVGESLAMTDAQKAALARAKREAAIAARRGDRAKLPGPVDDDDADRLAQVEHDAVALAHIPGGDAADLEGVFELEDEEAPETAEGVTTAIEGLVLDQATGAPIAGARVALFSSFYKPHLAYDRHLSELGGGLTDAEGRFHFGAVNLDAVHYRGGEGLLLIIRHDHYASWSNAPPRPITEGTHNHVGDIRLAAAGIALAGQVRNRDGSPLPDMLVTISPENPVNVSKPQRQILLKSLPSAVTDGDGRYRIDGLTPGKVWISVHAALDGVLFQALTITTTREDLNFTVRVGGAVTGRLIDRRGRPVASARIDGSGNTTHSNADGTFLLENLDTPGPFRISITHHAYYPRHVDDVHDGYTGLEVVLDPLPVATLVVRASDTLALLTDLELLYNAPAAVRATIPTSPYRHAANGAFPVPLYPNALSIRVFKQGFTEQTIALRDLAGGTSREVVLQRTP